MLLGFIPVHLSIVLTTLHAGVVAEENELCGAVEYIHVKQRIIGLELIRGYYLQKEVERVTNKLAELRALRRSGTSFVCNQMLSNLSRCLNTVMEEAQLMSFE